MKQRPILFAFVVILAFIPGIRCLGADSLKATGSFDVLVISGVITNPQEKGVKDCALVFNLNNEKIELEKTITSSRDGTYEAELRFPAGRLAGAQLTLEIHKPSYQSFGRLPVDEITREKIDDKGNSYYLAHKNLILKRAVTPT